MDILKKILKICLALGILSIIILSVYLRNLKPTYDGALNLSGIENKVKTYFDTYGIPHIYADTEKDAMVALGYVHAQDRLWQMELMRRIAPGRLSEILGEKTLATDTFFSSLGIEEAGMKAISELDRDSKHYILANAYLNGINQFIENGTTPLEFSLVGVKKEKYTLIDVYNIFGYMSFSFAIAHKTDPLLSKLQASLGFDYVSDLGINTNPNSTFIKSNHSELTDFTELSSEVSSIMKKTPIPPFIGSNSWVLAPEKTSTGKVLFANDPHIGYSQPSVWYEAHITTPNHEMYGYYLAGTPFPLLGHNRNYAWGLTMFENDDIDFYIEENNPKNPKQYKTATGYQGYTFRNKTIKVKGQPDVELEIKESQHGPIMNGIINDLDSKKPLAMQWIYTQQPSKILSALYQISHSNNINEFEKGVALIHAPGLNVMYGDAQNNIAWWATGKLYELPKHVNSKFILDGTSGKDERVRFLDFSENPQAKNPSWNYVYSANNQPDSVAGKLYPGYYLPEDRAKRIVQLLEPKNDWDKTAVGEMITDNVSAIAPKNVMALASVIKTNDLNNNEKQAWEVLKNWKGDNETTSIGPVIYNKWIYLLLKNTLLDEMGNKDFEQLLQTILIKKTVNHLLQKEHSVWWNNTSTNDIVESKSDILNTSFKEAVNALINKYGNDVNTWTWGKEHQVTYNHSFERAEPSMTKTILEKVFHLNIGPFPIDGSKAVINNIAFNYSDSENYNVNHGPSTRRVIDFSDIENSMSILPTGQSGNVFSPHYKDQAEMYVKGVFRKMLLNKNEIETTSKNKLVFNPK